MIDLDKLFQKQFDNTYGYYKAAYNGYSVGVFVGIGNVVLSQPENKHLSLNDYTQLTIEVRHLVYGRLDGNTMNAMFGFDFLAYPENNGRFEIKYAGFGWNVPKHCLITILQKLGVISAIPIDAGDGE